MSILDTFYILFQTNSAAVVKGETEITAASERTALALDKSGKVGESMGQKIAESGKVGAFEVNELSRIVKRFGVDFIRQVAEMGTSLIGLIAVEQLFENVLETADVSDKLGLTAKALGVNVSDLDAWDQAVMRSGGTAEGFQASIKSLNEKLAGVELGTRGKETLKFFDELGVHALGANGKMRPILSLLPELADKLSKMPKEQATAIGMRLGLDQGTVSLLEQGRKAVDDLVAKQRALGVVTEKDTEIADDFENKLADFKQALRNTFVVIDDYVLPILDALMDAFETTSGFLEDHKDVVEGFFIALAGIISFVYLPAMLEAAVATLIATAPIWLTVLALGALATAFALAYDDIKNFLEGNNSLIGMWLDKWLGPNGAKAIRSVLTSMGQWFVDLGKTVEGAIQDMINIWDKFMNALNAVEKLPGNLLKKLGLGSEKPEVETGPAPPGIRAPVAAPVVHSRVWYEEHPDAARPAGAAFQPTRFDLKTGIAYPAQAPPALPARGPFAAAALAAQAPPALPRPPGLPPLHDSALDDAKAHLAATATPLAAQTPSSIGAHQGNVTITTTVGDTTVNTQATDPNAVAKIVKDTTLTHIRTAINHYTDGVQG